MTPTEFEVHIRKLGRLKWAGTTGASEVIGGSQIDAVFRMIECTHLVEITVERTMEKVRADMNKLVAARRSEEDSTDSYTVACWMVMLAQPTPDQKTLARSSRVQLLSLDEFRDPLLGHTEYVHLRSRYPFGSISDPAGKSSPDKIVRIPTPIASRPGCKDITLEQLIQKLLAGNVIILLGDFGAGKSISSREAYFEIDRQMESSPSVPFPVAVNLRDMWGAETADEVFLRHARQIGSSHGLDLLKAWMDGFVCLILDGFDEVAPQPWATHDISLSLVRRKAVSAIRDLLGKRPAKTGMLVTGRANYFSSDEQLCEALDVRRDQVSIYELRELTNDEAKAFLPPQQRNAVIAEWMPRRPLLLSYLVGAGFLDTVSSVATEQDVGSAWHKIINMVCEREAKISKSLTASSIVLILARLACVLRTREELLGPLSDLDLEATFRAVTSHQPDQDSWAILQRLPGVTFRANAGTGSGDQKWLVDEEWADALAGVGLAHMTIDPNFLPIEKGTVRYPLRSLGKMVAEAAIVEHSTPTNEIVRFAHEHTRMGADPTLIADMVLVAASIGKGNTDFGGLVVKDAHIDVLDFGETLGRNVTFRQCFINVLEIGGTPPDQVELRECVIETANGVAKPEDLPDWIINCEVEDYSVPRTNSDVMRSNLPEKIKMAVVVLRKTYLQPGRGRQMSALQRGVQTSRHNMITEIVVAFEKRGYVRTRKDSSNNMIVHAVRERTSEVHSLLSSPIVPLDAPWKFV